jgi:hypothetical protein
MFIGLVPGEAKAAPLTYDALLTARAFGKISTPDIRNKPPSSPPENINKIKICD